MSFDEELLIEKVVERPWEATIAQAIRVMEGADIEALGFKCRIGNGKPFYRPPIKFCTISITIPTRFF